MSDTQADTELSATPSDPAMAASDPAMFAPLTTQDNTILGAHLTQAGTSRAPSTPCCPSRGRKLPPCSTT